MIRTYTDPQGNAFQVFFEPEDGTIDGETFEAGWYWWGSVEPHGPFETEQQAIDDAMTPDNLPDIY